MYRATTFRLVWLLYCTLIVGGCERQSHLVEQHLLEFGTLIEITMIAEDLSQAQRLLTEIERRLQTYNNQWHAWEDSDLTRFNAALAQGESVEIPASLSTLLHLSRDYHDATDGLFNPALGKLIAAHGFHDSETSPATIAAIKQDIPTMRDLIVEGQLAHSRNPHLQIDLGGIAKGYAVGLISDYLDANGIEHYIVNAGGDLVTAGNRFGHPWRIGIQNPFAPGVIASLKLEGKHSLFTSGDYQRHYWRGERRAHHIIDPRTGESSMGQHSATILTIDPVRADVAATALMIDGMRRYGELAESLQIADFLIVSESREIVVSRPFVEKLEINSSWTLNIVN